MQLSSCESFALHKLMCTTRHQWVVLLEQLTLLHWNHRDSSVVWLTASLHHSCFTHTSSLTLTLTNVQGDVSDWAVCQMTIEWNKRFRSQSILNYINSRLVTTNCYGLEDVAFPNLNPDCLIGYIFKMHVANSVSSQFVGLLFRV